MVFVQGQINYFFNNILVKLEYFRLLQSLDFNDESEIEREIFLQQQLKERKKKSIINSNYAIFISIFARI